MASRVIHSRRVEAVCSENIFLMLFRPLLLYFMRAESMVKKDKPMTLVTYTWKLNPRVEKSSLLTSHWNLKRRTAWTMSSPKFSKTTSGKRQSEIGF